MRTSPAKSCRSSWLEFGATRQPQIAWLESAQKLIVVIPGDPGLEPGETRDPCFSAKEVWVPAARRNRRSEGHDKLLLGAFDPAAA